jgi:hypothetical protein
MSVGRRLVCNHQLVDIAGYAIADLVLTFWDAEKRQVIESIGVVNRQPA